jgi:ribosomal protein L18E
MPLIRRLPKRGFNNAAFHKNYAVVNLSDLSSFKEGTVVNEQLLRESKLIRGQGAGLKLLGDGELKHALTIEVDKVSASAREKIEKAGGSITLREKPVQGPREAQQSEPIAEASESESAAKPKARASKKPAAKKKTPAKAAPKKKPRKS